MKICSMAIDGIAATVMLGGGSIIYIGCNKTTREKVQELTGALFSNEYQKNKASATLSPNGSAAIDSELEFKAQFPYFSTGTTVICIGMLVSLLNHFE